MDITNFLHACQNEASFLEFFHAEFFLNIPQCRKCNNYMRQKPSEPSMYRCYRRINGMRCNTEVSILKDSVLFKSRLSYHDFFYVINGWRMGVMQDVIACDIKKDQSTVSRLYSKLDTFTNNFLALNRNIRIGGVNQIVEVDECLLVKRKYRRGRILRGQKWIVGGVVRGDINQYFIEFVPHRSRRILLDVLRRHIAPGSIIITDEWAAYRGLEWRLWAQSYTHLTVNHSLFFVDPITGANTQTVECFWSVMKRVLRKKGTNTGEIAKRIAIFHVERFKKAFRDGLFFKMFEVLRYNMLFE